MLIFIKKVDVGGWIILKWILNKQDRSVCIGFMWLRIGAGGGIW
jgi:hypothetical protein